MESSTGAEAAGGCEVTLTSAATLRFECLKLFCFFYMCATDDSQSHLDQLSVSLTAVCV